MLESHRIAMLGTGFIGAFYTTTLHSGRKRDRVQLVFGRNPEKAKQLLKEARRCARRLGGEGVGYATVWSKLLYAAIAAQNDVRIFTIGITMAMGGVDDFEE